MPDCATTSSSTFLPQAASVRDARAFVVSLLDAWGLSDAAPRAVLLTSEVVTNAILHAGTTVTVTLRCDESREVVRVTVRDGSAAMPKRRRYGPLATTGRGLAMVAAAAHSFGVDSLPVGKDVWFELSTAQISPASEQGAAR